MPGRVESESPTETEEERRAREEREWREFWAPDVGGEGRS
jgi:hypothetical protein